MFILGKMWDLLLMLNCNMSTIRLCGGQDNAAVSGMLCYQQQCLCNGRLVFALELLRHLTLHQLVAAYCIEHANTLDEVCKRWWLAEVSAALEHNVWA